MGNVLEINKHKIEVSNKEKSIFHDEGINKGDLIDYYENIAEYMLPYLRERPLMMQRFPDGIGKKGFYQKDRPDYFPEWIKSTGIKKKEGGQVEHVLCNDKATLVYLANQACITFHGWLSCAKKPDHPDKIVMDIDPSEKDSNQLNKAMKKLHEFFEDTQLKTFPMTTGSAGYHIVIPISSDKSFEDVKNTIDRVAKELSDTFPDTFTTAARKENRGKAIYLDVQRNAYAQTSVLPFSLRAKKGAPVATPLNWEEAISSDMNPQKYSIKNIFRRLGQADDIWPGFDHKNVRKANSNKLEQWIENRE